MKVLRTDMGRSNIPRVDRTPVLSKTTKSMDLVLTFGKMGASVLENFQRVYGMATKLLTMPVV